MNASVSALMFASACMCVTSVHERAELTYCSTCVNAGPGVALRGEGTARLRSKLWTSGTQPRGRLRTWGYGGMGRDLESTVLAVFG